MDLMLTARIAVRAYDVHLVLMWSCGCAVGIMIWLLTGQERRHG